MDFRGPEMLDLVNQHAPTLKGVGASVALLPLDGGRGFGRNVVNDAVDALHFIDDPV